MNIQTKRIYEAPSPSDGIRILVDRVWPRGVSKERADLAFWFKEIAPSTELREWFNHDPEKWPEFKKRYFKELDKIPNEVMRLQKSLRKGTVTLLYGAKDEEHNQAIALEEYLRKNHL